MDSLPERLAQIESASATSRPAQYSQVLSQLLSSPRSELPSEAFLTAANTYLDRAVFSDANSTGGGLVVGRQVLAEFEKAVEAATKVEKDGMEDDGPQVPAVKDPDVRRQILEDALEKVQPKVLSFEEQVSSRELCNSICCPMEWFLSCWKSVKPLRLALFEGAKEIERPPWHERRTTTSFRAVLLQGYMRAAH